MLLRRFFVIFACMMKIVVAPDSYKECLTASEVAEAIAAGLEEAGVVIGNGKEKAKGVTGNVADEVRKPVEDGVEVVRMPVADGGEGTLEVLLKALHGEMHSCTVTGPTGKPREARYGIVRGTEQEQEHSPAGSTAIIEIAEACGLQLLKPSERNPLKTTTRGVGELLLEARRKGCGKFLIGLGGSATCDGGEGMMEVLGLREAMMGAEVTILCDVDNPFTGPGGAARVFAPQKGASPEDVEILEARLQKTACKILQETGIDITLLPGAGAAGGLGGAFMAYFSATRTRGIDAILDLLHFDRAIQGADLIITGDGKSDSQTLSGKAAYGVLRRSGNVPVALLSGRIEDSPLLEAAGFKSLIEVTPRSLPLEDALKPDIARENLGAAARKCYHWFQ